jgi:flagellar hook-length control protein FliK
MPVLRDPITRAVTRTTGMQSIDPVTDASRRALDGARSTDVAADAPRLADGPADTDTAGPEQRTASIDMAGDTDPLKALTQGLAPMAAKGVEAAHIDLDSGSADRGQAAMRRNAGQVGVDPFATTPEALTLRDHALPATTAALHAAGLKLTEGGGAHARIHDGMRAPQALTERETPGSVDATDIAGDASDASDLSDSSEANGSATRASARPGATSMTDGTRAIGEAQTGETARSDVGALTKTGDRIDPDRSRLNQDARAGEPGSPAQRRETRETRRMDTVVGTPDGQAHTASRAGQVATTPRARDRGDLRPGAGTSDEARDARLAAMADHQTDPTDPTAGDGRVLADRAAASEGSKLDRASPLEVARAGAQATGPQARVSISEARTRAAAVDGERSPASDAAGPGAAAAETENPARPETALAGRNVASAGRRDAQEQTARSLAVASGSELAGHPAWQAAQAMTSHLPESRAARPAPPFVSSDSARATSRIAVTRRESTQGRTEARSALADLTSPPATALPAPMNGTMQSAWTGTFDAALRTVDITDSNRHRDADARALAAGTLPATSADNTFSAALDLAGPALPEFMLRESLDSPAFAPALSARIATLVRDGVEEARIQLNPAEMGPVAVQLAMEGSDVRVDLAAEVESTRQILEQALPSLASALRESGFTLTGGGVFQQPRDTSGGGQAPQNGRTGRAGTDPADERVSTISLTGTGRQPPRGLVDLYA